MEILQIFEHQGRLLQLASYDSGIAPGADLTVKPGKVPGTGLFEISDLTLSAERIALGGSLTLSAQLRGTGIAFIFTELLLRDAIQDRYYGPVAQEYVLSAANKEVQGLTFPIWEESINLSLQISPLLRVLTNGVESAFAFLRPNGYGVQGYHVEGLLRRASTGTERRARMGFDLSGSLTGMTVYKEKRGRSSVPHALTLEGGDQFSPFADMLTPPLDDSQDWVISRCISPVLNYSGEAFRWVTETPLPGDYLLGLVVQDLDGQRMRQYVPFQLG